MFIGKILGAAIGFFSFGPVGLVVGVLVGHFFDRGRSRLEGRFDPEKQKQAQTAFFQTVFPLLGQLAKADGRVSEDEIASTEQLIVRMGLDGDARQEAIQLFKMGTAADFPLESVVQNFMSVCGNYGELKQFLLVYLITLAYADGNYHSTEEALLKRVASQLGYSTFAFNHLLGMVQAQDQFTRRKQEYRGGGSRSSYESGYSFGQRTERDELKLAYEALGVDDAIGDAELKKAYRKLMSEYHPDKLSGRGVPDEMIKVATERSQEIQAAYDLIKKSRKK